MQEANHHPEGRTAGKCILHSTLILLLICGCAAEEQCSNGMHLWLTLPTSMQTDSAFCNLKFTTATQIKVRQ